MVYRCLACFFDGKHHEDDAIIYIVAQTGVFPEAFDVVQEVLTGAVIATTIYRGFARTFSRHSWYSLLAEPANGIDDTAFPVSIISSRLRCLSDFAPKPDCSGNGRRAKHRRITAGDEVR